MSLSRVEQRLREVNASLYEEKAMYLCVGGTFGNDDTFDRGIGQLIGGAAIISPVCFHNSYWSKGQVERDLLAISAFSSGDSNAGKIHVFYADGPANRNYEALDIPVAERQKLARRQNQQLGQSILRGIDGVEKNLGKEVQDRISVSDWEKITQNPVWIEERQKLVRLYETSAEFRADVEALTREVLSRRYMEIKRMDISPAKIKKAVVAKGINYTLDEMAFVAASPRLLDVEQVCFVYHKDWPVYRKWADGIYDGEPKDQFGFLIVHAAKNDYSPNKPVVLQTEEITRLASTRSDFVVAQKVASRPVGEEAPATISTDAKDSFLRVVSTEYPSQIDYIPERLPRRVGRRTPYARYGGRQSRETSDLNVA